jgi:predicted phosphohydrolase
MRIKRPTNPVMPPVITDDATIIMTLFPAADEDDKPGEFTVFLSAAQSEILETGDIFDIELSLPQRSIVWTVAQGGIVVLEDVTD